MIRAVNVSVRIQGKTLVDRMSLQVEPGVFSILLGKNGAGKSTFLKALIGDVQPSEGDIRIDGRHLREYPSAELAKRRAVMMQSLHLAFGFTAIEVVMMGRSPHAKGFETARDHAIVRDCMRQSGVAHLADRVYPTLSGGEKQRVQFARMLAQLWEPVQAGEPCVLLLDEPVSSLDLAHQHLIMKLARSLSRRNVAVMMILHDLNLAAQYADQVSVMKDGAMLASGTPDEVFRQGILEEAYDHPVYVIPHPHFGCPLIIAGH